MDDPATDFARHFLPLFTAFCHRNPSRSFLLSDGTALLCARCMGLYAGAFAGLLASLVWRFSGVVLQAKGEVLVLAAAILATPLEVGGELAGLWDGSRELRATLGLATGAAAACAIIRAMGEGAAAAPDRNRGWLRVLPLLFCGLMLPVILSPHRWGAAGSMIVVAVFSLGLAALVAGPVLLSAILIRRLFSSSQISEGPRL